jgi:hypothetical protein
VYLQSAALDHGRMLDLEKDTLLPAEKKDASLGCHGRDDVPICAQLPSPRREPCHPSTPLLGKTLKQAYESFETEALGEIVTVGWTPEDGNAPYFGVGATRRQRGAGPSGRYEVTWEKRLSSPDEAGRERNFRYAFARRRLLLAYQTPLGPYRVIARDSATGEIAWSHVLESTAEGSILDAIKGSGNRVYVVVDGRLVVLEAETGAVLTRALLTVTLPD